MTSKTFKNREELEKFINEQANPHFYIVKEEIKGFLRKKIKVDIYNFDDIIEYLKTTLTSILSALDFFNLKIDIDINFNKIYVNINCNNNALLIGKNGHVLNSLQNISNCYLSSKFYRKFNIKIDINNYQEKQEKSLIRLAHEVAKEVLKNKQDKHLQPMNNSHRRIIHSILTKYDNIATQSTENGFKRHIIVKYVEK